MDHLNRSASFFLVVTTTSCRIESNYIYNSAYFKKKFVFIILENENVLRLSIAQRAWRNLIKSSIHHTTMILALASASFLQILGPADEEGTLLTADSLFDSLTKTAIASRNSRQQTKIPLSACIPQASRICVYMSSVFTGQQQARNFTVHQSLVRFFFK